MGMDFSDRQKSRRLYIQLDDPHIQIKVYAEDLDYHYNCRYGPEDGNTYSRRGSTVCVVPMPGSFNRDVGDEQLPPKFRAGDPVSIRVGDYAQFYGQKSRSRWVFIVIPQRVEEDKVTLSQSLIRNSVIDIDLLKHLEELSQLSSFSENQDESETESGDVINSNDSISSKVIGTSISGESSEIPKKGKRSGSFLKLPMITIFSLLFLPAVCQLSTVIEASTRPTLTSRHTFTKGRTGVSGFGSRSIKKSIFSVPTATTPSPLASLRGEAEEDVEDTFDEDDSAREKGSDRDPDQPSETQKFTTQSQAIKNANAAVDETEGFEDTGGDPDVLVTGDARELWVQRSDDDPSVMWVLIGSDKKVTLRLSVSAVTGDWQVERKHPNREFLKQYPLDTWVPIEGFYGIYRVPSGILWVLVSKTEPIYTVPPTKTHSFPSWEFRRVVNLEIVHLSRPIINENTLSLLQLREEGRQLKLLRKAMKQHDFYYIPHSNATNRDSPPLLLDMTKTFQRSALDQVNYDLDEDPAWWRIQNDKDISQPDPRFFWNQHAVEPLVRRYQTSRRISSKRLLVDLVLQNVIPVTSAFVGVQRNITIEAAPKKQDQVWSYDELLISRRSRFRAGTRFTVRGADATGAVANFVETEQLCLLTKTNEGQERYLDAVASHVQVRGSIPLRWSSPADIKTYRPRVRIGTDPVAQARALKLHLLEQLSIYSLEDVGDRSPDIANIVFVNLVDKKSDQGRLGKTFDSVLQAVVDVYSNNTSESTCGRSETFSSLLKRSAAHHIWYDFHHEVKQGRWDRLSKLLGEVQPSLDGHEYFFARAPSEDEDWWSVNRLQNAVVRTNCMDCLDRTNVVQSIFGRYMLFQQLSELDDDSLGSKKKIWTKLTRSFKKNPLELPWKTGEQAHRLLWADNADAISRLYAGTPALKGDFTRTGKRTKMGALDDGMNSLQRYYLNNFLDADRQEGYDLMVGYTNFSNVGEIPLEMEEVAFPEGCNDDGPDTDGTGSSNLVVGVRHLTTSIRESARGEMLKDVLQGANYQNREDVRCRLADIGIVNGALGDPLELRWLPGDLQTHVRSLADEWSSLSNSMNGANAGRAKNGIYVPEDGFHSKAALKAIDERSTQISPWWTHTTKNWLSVDIASDPRHPSSIVPTNILSMMLVVILGSKSPNLLARLALAILSFVYLPTCVHDDWQQRSRLKSLLARIPILKQQESEDSG
jgi:hypothetical protein